MSRDLFDIANALATGLSAIGTLAAVIVALFLASRSDQRRTQEAEDKASLLAARVAVGLEATLGRLPRFEIGEVWKGQNETTFEAQVRNLNSFF